MTYLETLKQSAEAIGLSLSDEALRRFAIYKDELLETNRSLNLTAITDPEEVAVKHMVDSLTVYNEKRFHNRTIADVGTGAGFPGLPLKIYDPTMRLTLIDSLAKRLAFLERVAGEMGLGQVRCHHARAEEAGRDPNFGKNSTSSWPELWRPCLSLPSTACPLCGWAVFSMQ